MNRIRKQTSWDVEREYMHDTVNGKFDSAGASGATRKVGIDTVPVQRVTFDTKRTFFAAMNKQERTSDNRNNVVALETERRKLEEALTVPLNFYELMYQRNQKLRDAEKTAEADR